MAAEFGVDEVVDDLPPSFNIAPTHEVAVVVSREETKRIVAMRWGLIPFWAADTTIGSKLINARAESLTSKSAFKEAFRKRRCLVIADGFYEWRKQGKNRIPLLIRLKADRPFGFAGLYEVWRGPLGERITSCTIVTTDANDIVRPIHDRMPVILPKELESFWLDHTIEDHTRLLDILTPYSSAEIETYEVSNLVNSVKNDSPSCIEPAPPANSLLLF